jgi:hypothetical protein
MITTTREKGYVMNKVVGNVTIMELVEYAQNNLEIWLTEPVLWDLSRAKMNDDKSDYVAVNNIVRDIHEMAEKRKGKRTVFCAPDPLSFGMLRMAITIVESFESRFIASVYNDINEAKSWLLKPGEDENSKIN